MRSILETCRPREELLRGRFNPAIFTPNLMAVLESYRGEPGLLEPIYGDASLFFAEGSVPTEGLRRLCRNVFERLAGDPALPAVQILSAAFGGGKTHALIAITHLAMLGRELRDNGILPNDKLHAKGSIEVLAIAGDELPVEDAGGARTLWSELAVQMHGGKIPAELGTEARCAAAPGRRFLERLFGDRKVLILIDELALYASRLSALGPEAAAQLPAFLMALFAYARSRDGISIVSSLASFDDAFSRETKALFAFSEREARQATLGVLAREGAAQEPVNERERVRIFARRLFTSTDAQAAAECAEAYGKVLGKLEHLQAHEAHKAAFTKRVQDSYPFHPELIGLLTEKLSGPNGLQSTRGILRCLALCVQRLWQKGRASPLIHCADLDLRDVSLRDELLRSSLRSDLLPALGADVSRLDDSKVLANAERADLDHPHPRGIALHEEVWRTVFLHSIAKGAKAGITEGDLKRSVCRPGLSTAQVDGALAALRERAFYLSKKGELYLTATDANDNKRLHELADRITDASLHEYLHAKLARLSLGKAAGMHALFGVTSPDDVPDQETELSLCFLAFDRQESEAQAYFTRAANGKPRLNQNRLILLVPETSQRLLTIARRQLAMEQLARREHSEDLAAKIQAGERELVRSLLACHTRLFVPSAGAPRAFEIRAEDGAGDSLLLPMIASLLTQHGELLDIEQVSRAELFALRKLIFGENKSIAARAVRQNFARRRDWPMVGKMASVDSLLAQGIERALWKLDGGKTYVLHPKPGKQRASEKSTGHARPAPVVLSGAEARERLLPLLSRIGSHYRRGARSDIDRLVIRAPDLPGAAELHVTVENATPKSMAALAELFEVLAPLLENRADLRIEINEPKDGWSFVDLLVN